MHKKLPLSAILSSLIASPLLAVPAARPQDLAPNSQTLASASSVNISSESAPADVQARLEDALQMISQGQPLDAHGMQSLQRKMSEKMQAYINRTRDQLRKGGVEPTYPIQYAPNAPTEKAAFLGVSTTPVVPLLRDQLSIPRGMGLVVDYVEKDSPAANIGLKVHDVLEKLDDQWLINAQQLVVLVRSKKPGDSVTLTYLRGGKEATLSAKLAEKDLPVLESASSPSLMPNPGQVAPNFRWEGGPEFQLNPRGSRYSVRINPDGSQSRTMSDEQHTISITRERDGAETLVVKDLSGNTLYSGPADKADVAPEIRKKVDDLRSKSNRMDLRLNNPGEARQGENNHVTVGAATVTRSDTDHVITIRKDDSGQTLSVKDLKTGQTLYDGKLGDAQIKLLPEDVAQKVKALNEKANVPLEPVQPEKKN